MRHVSVLLVVLLLAAVGCKNSKKSSTSKAEASATKTEAAVAEAAEVKDKPEQPKEELKPADTAPAQAKTEQPAPKYADSLFLRIDRTPCFGQCPVYRVDIYHSGRAYMTGKQFFDYQGTYQTRFSEGDMEYMLSIAEKHGYFDFDHVYDAPVTDLPSTTTIIHTDSRENWVYNRFNSPDELRAFELEIETLIKDRQWKAYTPVNRD